MARRAAKLDFAAQQVRQFAADGETQTGAAVFPAGAGVGLLERLKDDFLFFDRNADTGVQHLECNDRRGRAEYAVFRTPTADRGRCVELNTAVFGEFKGVRQQVLEHLLKTLGVGGDAAAEMRINLDVE